MEMKKLTEIFLVVIFIIVFAIPVFAMSNEPIEVPMDSWEYNAVVQLAAKGYFTECPDELGKNPITRDEAAAMLESALPVNITLVSKEDADMLEKLVDEFRAELLEHGVKHVRGLDDVDKINPTWK